MRNSVFSRVERSGTSGKTLNFSHEWKKSQIFNEDECKYLFLPFQLKNKACRFHSFIRMSMSCLLHKILQCHISRVPDERFLRICLNGITHTCMIHRWNEENKPHRNKDVVAMHCGHVFFKLGSKVKI